MTGIQKLIESDDTIFVFDVDGVLARMEYGEHNHFDVDDDTWTKLILNGKCFYPDEQAIPSMVKFVKSKDINKIYVCSKSFADKEDEMKKRFLISAFGILEDHIYFVRENADKLNVMFEIKQLNEDIPDEKIAMVDDTVSILNNIKEKSKFATIHVSSFML